MPTNPVREMPGRRKSGGRNKYKKGRPKKGEKGSNRTFKMRDAEFLGISANREIAKKPAPKKETAVDAAENPPGESHGTIRLCRRERVMGYHPPVPGSAPGVD
jgi:hypothetical protein